MITNTNDQQYSSPYLVILYPILVIIFLFREYYSGTYGKIQNLEANILLKYLISPKLH